MSSFKLIKLKNLTPLHIGTGKENYDFSASELQSDTLSSAIAALRVQHCGDRNTKAFLNSFTISSAFPYIGDHFFLPKMQGKIQITMDGEEHIIRKRLKKIRYVELDVWNDLVQGKQLKINFEQLNGEFLTKSSDFQNPSKSIITQRVSVPRGELGKTDPFFFEWRFFRPESGLFCLVDCDKQLFEEIVSLFKLLGEVGLGTDKNVGGGKFEVDTGELALPEISDANHAMLLSLYIPEKMELEELNLSESKFDLLLRGGFMAGSNNERFRHLRKKSIYMFGVGSLFPTLRPLYGKVVDLKPEWNDEQMHSVFKSGRPFYLHVKKQTIYE